MKKSIAIIFRFLEKAILIVPIILIILPANYFDTGQTVCLSKLFLHIDCPGCGITRAIQHALHLEFKTAYHFNKLVIIVLPLLTYLYFTQLSIFIKQIKNKDQHL